MLQNFTQNGRSQFFGRAGSKAVDYVDIGGPSENWIPLYHLPLCKYWDVKFSDERGQAIDFPATEGGRARGQDSAFDGVPFEARQREGISEKHYSQDVL